MKLKLKFIESEDKQIKKKDEKVKTRYTYQLKSHPTNRFKFFFFYFILDLRVSSPQ